MADRDAVPGLGAALRAARERAGLTQAAAGAAAGVHAVSIAQYETGARTPGVATLLKLAAGYGTTAGAILGALSAAAPPEGGRPGRGRRPARGKGRGAGPGE